MSIASIAGLAGQLGQAMGSTGVGMENQPIGPGMAESGRESFASMLDRHVSEVNDLLKVADQKSTALAVGKSENLHDAMISVEKAETAFKFMVQLRNKALEAYNDIIRMQV